MSLACARVLGELMGGANICHKIALFLSMLDLPCEVDISQTVRLNIEPGKAMRGV